MPGTPGTAVLHARTMQDANHSRFKIKTAAAAAAEATAVLLRLLFSRAYIRPLELQPKLLLASLLQRTVGHQPNSSSSAWVKPQPCSLHQLIHQLCVTSINMDNSHFFSPMENESVGFLEIFHPSLGDLRGYRTSPPLLFWRNNSTEDLVRASVHRGAA